MLTLFCIAIAIGAITGLVIAVRDGLRDDDEVILRITVKLPDCKSSAPPSA